MMTHKIDQSSQHNETYTHPQKTPLLSAFVSTRKMDCEVKYKCG